MWQKKYDFSSNSDSFPPSLETVFAADLVLSPGCQCFCLRTVLPRSNECCTLKLMCTRFKPIRYLPGHEELSVLISSQKGMKDPYFPKYSERGNSVFDWAVSFSLFICFSFPTALVYTQVTMLQKQDLWAFQTWDKCQLLWSNAMTIKKMCLMKPTMKILPASTQDRKRRKRKMKMRITHYLQVRLISFFPSHLFDFSSELSVHKGNTRPLNFRSWMWLLHLSGLDYMGTPDKLIQNNT